MDFSDLCQSSINPRSRLIQIIAREAQQASASRSKLRQVAIGITKFPLPDREKRRNAFSTV
jgi:hypothetical protein